MLSAWIILMAAADCRDVSSCNREGTALYKAGQYEAAKSVFDRQIDFAESREGSADDISAYNNAALAWWKSGECLAALQYVRLALSENTIDKASLFNKQKITEGCQAQLKLKDVSGEYWQYAGNSLWNTVRVRALSDGYQVEGELLHVTGPLVLDSGRVNVGDINARGKIEGGVFSGYFIGENGDTEQSPQECRVQFNQLSDGALEFYASKADACVLGGMNVGLGGRYAQVRKGTAGLEAASEAPPAARKLKALMLSSLVGDYEALNMVNQRWVIQTPCDADNATISVDAVNQKLYLGLGLEMADLEVQSVQVKSGITQIKAQSAISDEPSTIAWRDLGNGVVELEADYYSGKQRFVRVSARSVFPNVREQCVN
jgi:tetratricopeptide (TPR) repeat protein